MDATESASRVALANMMRIPACCCRKHVCRPPALNVQAFGIVLDSAKNDAAVGGKAAEIQADSSRIKILVLPTDEELSIAQQVGDSHAASTSCCCCRLQIQVHVHVIPSPADAGGCQRTPGGGIEQQCMQQLYLSLKCSGGRSCSMQNYGSGVGRLDIDSNPSSQTPNTVQWFSSS